MPDVIAARIRRAREAHGLAQTELGRQIGISGVAICKIESGQTTVYACRVRDIAQVLGIDARYLLGLRDEMEEPS